MEKKYWLHRISHESNVSYSLLEQGYLSLGWSEFSGLIIMEASREEGRDTFEQIWDRKRPGEKKRSRLYMWHFSQMKKGDIIIVPLFGGLFSAYEVLEPATSIKGNYFLQKKTITGKNGTVMNWRDGLLYDGNRQIDLGFLIHVKPIVQEIRRSIALSRLISRMKIRDTNAEITDIYEDVEQSIENAKENKPVDLYGDVIAYLKTPIKEAIVSKLDDHRYEKLIRWYMKRCGATYVWIPAKNEAEKTDGADADIIAEFENLKHIIYIQAKHHTGETGDWGVEQITKYKEQLADRDGDSGYSYAKWLISSADGFSQNAERQAAENGVRLIDGNEFAKMLIDAGLGNLNEAFTE